MKFKLKDSIDLIEKTVFLNERINGSFEAEYDHNNKLIDSYINKWQEVVAKGNRETFEKRLSLDNLDLNSARKILGKICLNENLPEWTEIFEKIINKVEDVSRKKHTFHDYKWKGKNPVPFQEILYPSVLIAREELIHRTGRSYHLASEESHRIFEHNLHMLLSNLCSETLYYEYIIYCTGKQSPYELYLDGLKKRINPEYYNSFLEVFFKASFINFFKEYPVLARFVSMCVTLWIEGTGEFFRRLEEDLPEISRVFCKGEEPGKLVNVKSGISDTHNKGRSVIALTFSSGLKLIYKPKDLSTEIIYFDLLSWFNQHISLKFKTLKIINRKDYGWVEFVECLPCKNKEEVTGYYTRAGHLLCIMYLMGGNDCHCENIIASGEYPVFIDLETLMQAETVLNNKEYNDRAITMADNKISRSVLKSGLLPSWILQGEKAYDIGGISGPTSQKNSIHRGREKFIDRNVVIEREIFQNTFNLPVLNGEFLLPFKYIEHIVRGFKEIYMLLMEHRDYLLSSHSPLNKLKGKKFRFIYRATRIYDQLLKKMLMPDFLKDAILFSIELDVLTRAILKFEQKELYSLIKSEISNLQGLDIPVFTGYSDRNCLVLSDGKTIENLFREPAYNHIISCLKGSGEEDLKSQVSFIRAILYEETDKKTADIIIEDDRTDLSSVEIKEEGFKQALVIAEKLEELAIKSESGEVIWIGYEYIPAAEILQLRPAGYTLFSGCCGISLFLSAVAHVTGNSKFANLALSAIEGTCRDIKDINKDNTLKEKILENGTGCVVGLGSIVYSLVSMSQFLGVSELLETAKIASLLINDLIKSDRQFDITGGVAGAILALLKLYDEIHEAEILKIARKCGKHLLENRVKSSSGYKTWKIPGNLSLSGFSHGAAGIVYALLRLYTCSEEKDLLEAAREAILYENTLYSKDYDNWSDLRETEDMPEERKFKTSWCHGAPGIGLGRIGGLCVLDNDSIRRDIDIAINKTIKESKSCDHLCCGNMGLVDILLTAGIKLDRSDFKREALLKTYRVLSGVKKHGMFNTGYEIDFTPGFFQGISGIGYELLRLKNPDIPSVLLFE